MKLVHGRPPNYEQILAVMPQASRGDAIFTYGDTIYRVNGDPIPGPIVQHELVHCAQQTIGSTPQEWWDRYLVDVKFRFEQELTAHQAEYLAVLRDNRYPNWHKRELFKGIAGRLAGPLYNNMVSLDGAMQAISAAVPVVQQTRFERAPGAALTALNTAEAKRQRKLAKRAQRAAP